MLGVVDLPTYLVGLILIILLPGPNSMYVLSVAARRGVRAGYAGAAGVFLGDMVLMVLSAAGVGAVLQANVVLFSIVKYAGAGYLAFLAFGMLRGGWQLWRHRRESVAEIVTEAVEGTGEQAPVPGENPFRRALLVSLLNPKAILFFIAFFVQFVDRDYAHPALSFAFLGALAQVASMLYLSVLIFAGSRLADAFRRRKALTAWASTGVGAAFLVFAAKLSVAS